MSLKAWGLLPLPVLALLAIAPGRRAIVAEAPVARRTGSGETPPGPAGYGVYGARGHGDTLRVRLADTRSALRRTRADLGGAVWGFFSRRGLPPVQGSLVVTDTGLVFRSADGRYAAILPIVGPVRVSAHGRWRASAVALAYAEDLPGRESYLFRVDGGVFETDAPGALLDIAAHPRWLDSLASREWTAEPTLVGARDAGAAQGMVAAATRSPYADSLYAVFGRPVRDAGVVGPGGRAAGRLGEYVASRDSLALDPARMTSGDQLRHTLAHELAHRWQVRSSGRLDLLWRGVRPIRDPKRYGYGNPDEQQAEAAAFAIHFLLSTAATTDLTAARATLDHYELLVPGTRTMARYFAMQASFGRHPLRVALTTSRPG